MQSLRARLEADPEAHIAPSVLGLALLQTGKQSEAAQCASQALGLATARGYRVFLPELLELSGTIAASAGDWKEAEDFLSQGIALAKTMSMPYHEARLLCQLGLVRTRIGSPRLGRQAVEAARAAFERLGARTYLERAQLALGAQAALETDSQA